MELSAENLRTGNLQDRNASIGMFFTPSVSLNNAPLAQHGFHGFVH